MQRTSQILFGLAALAGAVATGFLLVILIGDDGGRRSSASANADARRAAQRGGSREPRVAEVESARPGSGRVRGGANSSVRPGQRQPFDAETTVAERAQIASEVIALLQAIPESDSTKRTRELYVELQKLIGRLGRRVPTDVRDQLLNMLTTVDPVWRELVGDTLGNLRGDTETAGKLVALYRGKPENLRTRRAILRALGKMEVPEVVPELLKMLDEDYENKDVMVETLGRIAGRDVALGLHNKLAQPLEPRTRTAIESVLGNLKNPEVLERIASGLAEAGAATRTSYLNVLAATRNARYAGPVRNILERETDLRARKAAIRALGFFGDAESAKVLLDLVQGSSTQDKLDATRAMYQIRDRGTIEALAENWGGLSDDARLALVGAGARLADPGERIRKIAIEGLRAPERRVRTSSAQLLGKAGNDGAVGELVYALRSATTSGERTTILQALYKIKTEKAAQAGLDNLPGALTDRQQKYWLGQFEQILQRYK